MDGYVTKLLREFQYRNKQREFELSNTTILASGNTTNDGPRSVGSIPDRDDILRSSNTKSSDDLRGNAKGGSGSKIYCPKSNNNTTTPRAESTIRGGSETNERRFNVHKRSLPSGLDQIVASNISKEEFDKFSIAFGRPFKTKEVENGAIYYDLVPVDATEKEKSPYYNPPEIIKDETITTD